MRMKILAGGFAAAIAVSLLMPATASAFNSKKWYDRDWPYDPYAYTYVAPKYYPYYGSDYWKPRHKVDRRRFRYHQPPYYKAWGYCKLRWEECRDVGKWDKYFKSRKHYSRASK